MSFRSWLFSFVAITTLGIVWSVIPRLTAGPGSLQKQAGFDVALHSLPSSQRAHAPFKTKGLGDELPMPAFDLGRDAADQNPNSAAPQQLTEDLSAAPEEFGLNGVPQTAGTDSSTAGANSSNDGGYRRFRPLAGGGGVFAGGGSSGGGGGKSGGNGQPSSESNGFLDRTADQSFIESVLADTASDPNNVNGDSSENKGQPPAKGGKDQPTTSSLVPPTEPTGPTGPGKKDDVPPASVPEPGSLFLLATGAAGWLIRRRRKSARS